MEKADDMLYQQPDSENIHDFIAVLKQHQEQCESEGKYVEAEMAKNRVTELQGQYYENARAELMSNQAQQKEECEQAHIK